MSGVTSDATAAALAAELQGPERERASRETVSKVARLLELNGIDPADVGKINKVKLYQSFFTKGVPCTECGGTGTISDEDTDPQDCASCQGKGKVRVGEVVDMASVQLSPKWAEGPAWPVVQPAKPMVCRYAKRKRPQRDWQRAVILPDMQIGFYRDRHGALHPTHDEAALDVAFQVVYDVQPDLVVMVGDNMDFPELGRFRVSPAFAQTTQATVDRTGRMCAELRAVTGEDAEIIWLAGNHEERLQNYILDNAKAAFGLRTANAPASWPLLSVPSAVGTDNYGIEFRPGYPASDYWVNDRLRVIHGHKVKSGGSTAHSYLNEERTSTIYGHIHRREWAERTRSTRYGNRTILAASPGCLARIDGRVPSTKGGIDLDGMPISVTEDWQQGLAVVEFNDGDSPFHYQQVPIHDGTSHWNGQDYLASVDVEGQTATAT